ncbi:MAG: DNA polymerase III delta prime subunit, partial [uncultured Sphingomonadaceae bacterium]
LPVLAGKPCARGPPADHPLALPHCSLRAVVGRCHDGGASLAPAERGGGGGRRAGRGRGRLARRRAAAPWSRPGGDRRRPASFGLERRREQRDPQRARRQARAQGRAAALRAVPQPRSPPHRRRGAHPLRARACPRAEAVGRGACARRERQASVARSGDRHVRTGRNGRGARADTQKWL